MYKAIKNKAMRNAGIYKWQLQRVQHISQGDTNHAGPLSAILGVGNQMY